MVLVLLLWALLTLQDGPACEKCGRPVLVTAVRWMGSPSEAARKANAEEKLVFVVHFSGGALDPRGALSNVELGAYLNKHFVASFQRVPTANPGGAYVSYFCAPDGRVLHAVAGTVDAATMLAEAKWTVEASKKAIEDSRATEVPFKAVFRRAHAERLARNYGLVVEPVTFDAPEPAQDDPLTWRDPSGWPVAPPLVVPPVEGPDVRFLATARQAKDGFPDRKGRCWSMNAQSRIHQVLAAHALVKIERLYPTILQNLMGWRLEDRPWQCIRPADPERMRICPSCERE
ncbi:MAG TPA: hypothetical protein VMU54_08215 [Planctomycetota bacterium]|nr:hypothetical protein [Planctomycetota bacterium]